MSPHPTGGNTMSDQQNAPAVRPFWRRALAGFLDFLTIFFGGGLVIGAFAGKVTSGDLTLGFELKGWPMLLLLALIVLYFYLGWEKLGGTIWQRILKAR